MELRSYCPLCNAVFRTPFSRCPLDGTKLAELEGDPLVGSVLDKRYVIEECIGEGGMGRVYRAKHTRMSRHYAIKILFGDHAGDTRMRSRFAREAEAVSRLSHGNVISVVDFGETEEGLLYLVMDLADGESLAHLVHREAPLDPARSIEIIARLARGLSHAHRHGLVHRDFKCENVIMVKEEGIEVPKIVDFGICMIVEDAPAATMLTSNGMVLGTPAVMAPEQASGDKVDHRTDLFSLGIVGYQMLSGCLPFEGTPLEMARKNLYDTIPRIVDRCGILVDPGLEAIIHRLTAKNPDDRFQDAAEVLDALKALDMGASFDSWTNATPMPMAGRVPTPRPHSADATEMVSPLHHSEGYFLDGPSLKSRPAGARIAMLAIASVAVLLLVVGIATSGDSSSKTPAKTNPTAQGAATTAVDESPLTGTNPDAPTVTDPDAPTDTPPDDPDAITDEPGTDDPPDETEMVMLPDDIKPDDTKTQPPNNNAKNGESKAERIKRQRLLREARAKAKAKAKADRLKAASKSDEDDDKTRQDEALRYYAKVASSLTTLERTKGRGAAQYYQNKFGDFSRTQLFQKPEYAAKQLRALKLLHAAIIKRQRQD